MLPRQVLGFFEKSRCSGQPKIVRDRFAELGLFTQWYYHGTAIVLKSSKVLTLNVSQVLKAAKLYVHGATVIRAFGGVLLEMASESAVLNVLEIAWLADLLYLRRPHLINICQFGQHCVS